MKIKNWGWNCENETAKGYVMIAAERYNKEHPEAPITKDMLNCLLGSMSVVFSEKTAEEAYKYYCEN